MEVGNLLQATDWNEAWKRLQKPRHPVDDVAFWDNRADTFGSMVPSTYTLAFMKLADVQPGESILDMGCGTGNLAIPYALEAHPVIAADFSAKMLERCRRNAECARVSLETNLLSWQDDWGAAGIGENCVDVALASRSIATEDLKDALDKLTRAARRRCCITLTTGSSPRVDPRMLQAWGVRGGRRKEYQFAWNILVSEGFMPTCSYIVSRRKDTYDSLDEACAQLDHMIVGALGEDDSDALESARARMAAWLGENLVANEQAGATDSHGEVEKSLRLRIPRQFVWGFIAWDPRDVLPDE